MLDITVNLQVLLSQMTLGLINGAFYAILSLGLAVIFGMLNVINFAHGAQFMLGAFSAWWAQTYLGLSYWAALLAVPLVLGIFGVVLERLLLSRIYELDHLFGFLITYGIALVLLNWPPFRPDSRHNAGGLRRSSSTGLWLTIIDGSN